MRHEIDFKHRIVDFYIEDDFGREHHCALSFDEFEEMFEEIMERVTR